MKKIKCDCPKGGRYEREDGSYYDCEKCDGTEWVEIEESVLTLERKRIKKELLDNQERKEGDFITISGSEFYRILKD